MGYLAFLLSFLCTGASAQSVPDLYPSAPEEADSRRILVVDLASSQGVVLPSGLSMEPLSFEAEQSTAVSILKGTAMVVGGTVLGVGAAYVSLLTADVGELDELSGFPAALSLAAYPLVSASGVYLMGRVLGEEGSFFGALAAGTVAGAAGIALTYAVPLAFIIYIGSPIVALVGFHAGLAPVSGANSDVVPGLTYQIRF